VKTGSPADPGRADKLTVETTSPTMTPTKAATTTPPTATPSAGPTVKPQVPAMGGIGIPPANERPTATGRATALDLGSTMAPTTQADEMVYFTIQVDFFAGHEAEPQTEDIKAMICQAQKFFAKTLQTAVSPDVTMQAYNIDWEWKDNAALPSIVEFFADVRTADGAHVPAATVFAEMEKVDVKQFVQDYIWMSEVYKENIFYQTEDIFFAGQYSGSPNPPDVGEGKIQVVECAP